MILAKIFPRWCYLCHKTFSYNGNTNLCPHCFLSLPWWDNNICANCLLPKISCKTCKKEPEIFSIFAYQPPISKLIVSMKYSHNLYAAKILKKLIANWLEARRSFWQNYSFLPMPIHWKRFFVRNINPTEYLLPSHCQKINAKRILHLPPQASLPFYKRKRLLKKKVFKVTNKINAKKILIFDDIITTKSTILNLANQIKGGKEKKILCLARSLSKNNY